MKMKAILAAVVVLGAAGFGVYRLGGGETEQPAQNSSAMYATAERKTLELVAEAAGVVEPIRIVEVKSRASGEVLNVPVDTGDRVDAGTLLAEIDARDVNNAYAQAAADLEAARVQRETADAQKKRMVALRESGVVTQQEYESAVQNAATGRASVVRAETNLQLAKERRNDVIIRAPISGTVLLRSVQPGVIIASATSNVSGGTTLFTMADLSEMQVRAKVDETDIGRISPGQVAIVTVEAYPGRTFKGTVLKIEPQAVVEQNVTLFPVLVRLANPDGLLRPGMNAELRVEVAKKTDALTIPNAAVVAMKDVRSVAKTLGVELADPRRRGDGGTAARGGNREGGMRREGDERPAMVFVNKNGAIEARRVLVGLSDFDHTEVVSGLNEGDQVVLVSVAQMQQQLKKRQDVIRKRGILPSGGGTKKRGG